MQESSPLTPRMDLDYDDSMDGPPPSVASVDSGIITGTPKTIKKTPTGVRHVYQNEGMLLLVWMCVDRREGRSMIIEWRVV